MFAPDYASIILNTERANLLRYFPLDDAAGGAVDRSPAGDDGSYSGPTLENDSAPDGRPCPTWDGINDTCSIMGSNLDTDAHQWSSGTIMIWAKISGTGVLTDSTLRALWWFGADGDNQVICRRTTTDNTFQFWIEMADDFDRPGYVIPAGDRVVKWLHWAITWNWTGAQTDAIFYYQGAQVDTGTSANQWEDLDLTFASVGTNSTGVSHYWSGALAHCACWNTALSATNILRLYKQGINV